MELTEHSSGNHLCGPNKACELLQMLQQDNPIQVLYRFLNKAEHAKNGCTTRSKLRKCGSHSTQL